MYKAVQDVEKSDFKTDLKRRVKILQVEGKGLSHLYIHYLGYQQ